MVPEVRRSPYETALGERVDALTPSLRRYFAAIPEGSVGVGTGVFDRVGSPPRWLRPFLRPFARRGILFDGWERDVPFRVVNTPRGAGVAAERALTIGDRTWTMTDAVTPAGPGRIVDRLGAPPTVAAVFDVAVRDGALTLRSWAVGLRIGRLRLRIPRVVSPVVRLTEAEAAGGRQRVDVTIDVPLIGRVYEYGGEFDYRIEESA